MIVYRGFLTVCPLLLALAESNELFPWSAIIKAQIMVGEGPFSKDSVRDPIVPLDPGPQMMPCCSHLKVYRSLRM